MMTLYNKEKKRKCQWHYIMYFNMQITKIIPVLLCDPPILRISIFSKWRSAQYKVEIVVFALIVLHVTWLNLICVALLWRRFVYQKYIVMEWRSVNDLDK